MRRSGDCFSANRGSWTPYVQAKVIPSDNSDFVFGGGIRFVLVFTTPHHPLHRSYLHESGVHTRDVLPP